VKQVENGGSEPGSGPLLAGPFVWCHHASDASGAPLLLRGLGRGEAGAPGAHDEAAHLPGSCPGVVATLATTGDQSRVADCVGVPNREAAGGRVYHSV
jgi:hypothetical protein